MSRTLGHLVSLESFCLSLRRIQIAWNVRMPGNVHPGAYEPRVVRL